MRILNIRDISNNLSNKIKTGYIIRSAHPDKLTNKNMNNMGIKTIIDLRNEHERKKSKSFKNVRTINIPIDFDKKIIEKIKPLLNKRNVIEKLSSILTVEYKNLVESQKHSIYKIFKILIKKNNYPILIHCKAGKDRTGFVIAIILLALGINDFEIINDYLLSNQYYLPKIKKIIIMLKLLSFGFINTSNYLYLVTSHENNIQSIINTIKNNYQTIEKYLENCGVQEIDLLKIKEHLLIKCTTERPIT